MKEIQSCSSSASTRSGVPVIHTNAIPYAKCRNPSTPTAEGHLDRWILSSLSNNMDIEQFAPNAYVDSGFAFPPPP